MSEIPENTEFHEMLGSINFDDLDISYSPMNEESPKDKHVTEELLGVVPAPTIDAPSTSGLAPRDRVCGQTRTGLDPCQGSSPPPPPLTVLSTKCTPTDAELGLLALGLSFVPTPIHTPRSHATSFSTLENSFRSSLHTNFHHAKHPFFKPLYSEHTPLPPQLELPKSVSQYLTLTGRSLKKCRAIPPKSNLYNLERTALLNLSNNQNVLVTKAKKGDTVVVMDLEQYTELVYKHLNDAETYDKITTDPTDKIAKRFRKYSTWTTSGTWELLTQPPTGFFPLVRLRPNISIFYLSFIRHW